MDKKYRLPRVFTEKWIAALESGEYEQGKDLLYNPGTESFCCLGVGCLVGGIPRERIAGVDFPNKVAARIMLAGESLPKEMPEEMLNPDTGTPALDLLRELSSRNDGHVVSSTVNRNDDLNPDMERLNFKEIAQWIRDNVELYDEPQTVDNGEAIQTA